MLNLDLGRQDLTVDKVNLEIQVVVLSVLWVSGSGKSTLMKLLPKLYRLNSGAIYIDNDISKGPTA